VLDGLLGKTEDTPPPAPADAELEPDLQDVLQLEAPLAAMPVRIEGPVRTQQLPNRDRTARLVTATTARYLQLLTADPHRAFAEIESFDQDVYLAYDQTASIGDTNVQRCAKGRPYRITARTAVYVAAVTSTTQVSVAQERWANAE